MIDEQGWLVGAKKLPSPNCNLRPELTAISLLLIHNISLPPAQFGGGYIDHFFTNCLDVSQHAYFEEIAALRVSAHLLIDRLGQVTQFVAFNQRAWHAGSSCFDGVADCNDYSIGIELEGTDEIPYTSAQYQVLAAVTQQIMLRYPTITTDRIVGHSDVSPGRKTDPGPAFDWTHFYSVVAN